MTEAVIPLPGERRLAGAGWSLHAEQIEVLDGDGWRALIGIRRGLKLLVTGTARAEELEVEAWSGEPGASDGVAVIGEGDDLQIAPVPLCGCGDRGCGNVGIQLRKPLASTELRTLVDLLRELPWTEVIPTTSNVLHGSGPAAIQHGQVEHAH